MIDSTGDAADAARYRLIDKAGYRGNGYITCIATTYALPDLRVACAGLTVAGMTLGE